MKARSTMVLLGLMLSTTAWASTNPWQKYLPVKKGNIWEYSNGVKVTIDMASGGWYHSNYGGTIGTWSRWTGSTLVESIDKNTIHTLYKFGALKGQTYEVPSTNPSMVKTFITVGSKDDTVSVSAGTFKNCVRFDFKTPGLFDAGTESEWYAPGVGLVKRTYMTIGGTQADELVKARINGQWISNVAGAINPAALTLWAASSGEEVYNFGITYTIHNKGVKPVMWEFSPSQWYDVDILDASGNVKYAWKVDKMFFPELTLKPGEKRTFSITLKPTLSPGKYTIRAHMSVSYDAVPATAKLTVRSGVTAALSPAQINLQPGSSAFTVTYTITNASEQVASWNFNSGKMFDARIVDEFSDVKYTWSKGGMFTQAFSTLTVKAGESKSFEIKMTPPMLSAGTYTVKAFLEPYLEPPTMKAIAPLTVTVP